MATILLIEPDALLARTYQAALETAGYTVMVRAGAQAAITAADEEHPDVVVMELQLIQHSGVEFLYEFRSYADWLNVPVIILSHVAPGDLAGAHEILRQQLGVQEYLYKPHTSLRTLVRSVAELVPVSL
jgi:DNA-binding response OmpR family regulator